MARSAKSSGGELSAFLFLAENLLFTRSENGTPCEGGSSDRRQKYFVVAGSELDK